MGITKKERLEIKEATEKLLTLELPIPREVKTFFNRHVKKSAGYGEEYAEVIQIHNERLLQRVFCFKLHGYGKMPPTITEVLRKYENGETVVSNIVYRNYIYSFYQVQKEVDENKDSKTSGWNPKTAQIIKSRVVYDNPHICLNKEKWEKKYPYLSYNDYEGNECFFRYLVKYRANPKIEMLVKAGYSNLLLHVNTLNMNGKNFYQIFKLARNQEFAKEYLKASKDAYNELKLLRQYEWISSPDSLEKVKQVLGSRGSNVNIEVLKYLCKFDSIVTYDYYNDYLRFAEYLGYPLNQKKYRFPDNLKKAHDEAYKSYKEQEDKKYDPQIKELADKCKNLIYEDEYYLIKPCTESKELIDETKVLNHCVRTYVRKVANHESLVMFVRKTNDVDTPFVTVELVKNNSKRFNHVVQCRGIENSVPDAETTSFIHRWMKKKRLKGWGYAN